MTNIMINFCCVKRFIVDEEFSLLYFDSVGLVEMTGTNVFHSNRGTIISASNTDLAITGNLTIYDDHEWHRCK